MNAKNIFPLPVAGRRALVVDDDKFMQAVLVDMLHDLGIAQVSTAVNGMDGAALLDRTNGCPDLILCDINMPGNDGFQFMEKLAEKAFAGAIVLVSGMQQRVMKSATLMARFHRLNILGTLEKPVSKEELSKALEALRGSH